MAVEPASVPVPETTTPEAETTGLEAETTRSALETAIPAPPTTGSPPTTTIDSELLKSENGHGPDARPRAATPAHRRVWVSPVLGFVEFVVATVPAVLFVSWSRNIDVDPLTRVGQVSALAALQLRFAIISIVLVAILVLVHRFGPGWLHEAAIRVGCALVAGLATALPAAAAAVAVRHTPWALWANAGDNNWILFWTHNLLDGKDIPGYYPPLSLWALADWSRISGQPPEYALQDIQLFGAAMFGPAAYLTWRLTLRPVWALAIGVVAGLPFFEPVKPYAQITLVMMVPILVKFLHVLRHADRLAWWRAVLLGLAFGAGIGVLVLLYSGWFVWSAAGAVLAALVVMPYRAAPLRALVFGLTTLATTVGVSWVHLRALLDSTGATADRYFYADTNTEPAYIAMWRNDRPVGAGSIWPPLGELGGVGLFTVLLAVGAGVAIWFGWRRTVVLALGCVAASAWVIRMWLAAGQYQTMSVRLYPRTTMLILSCLLLLAGFGVRYAVIRWRDRTRQPGFRMAPVGLLLVPLLFFFASAGSATGDKYMPVGARESVGYFTYIAQHHYLLDGSCPPYGQRHGGCSIIVRDR
jgi:galactan 5-O-arabinofuranosyltransferase